MDDIHVALGDIVRVTDPATETVVCEGPVVEAHPRYFGLEVGGHAPRRFNFAPGGQIAPVDRPHRYRLDWIHHDHDGR